LPTLFLLEPFVGSSSESRKQRSGDDIVRFRTSKLLCDKIKEMRVAAVLVLTIFVFLVPIQVHASEDWVINSFQADIDILEDGRVQVVESIKADFGNLQKHGIFRDIPEVYERTGGGKHYTKLEVKIVKNNGANTPYEILKENGYARLKIGDSDETITGVQNYTIEYLVSGVLKSFEDHDELYWNATGDRWPVPIESAKATVTLPSGQVGQITCYEGPRGAQDLCDFQEPIGNEASFEASRSLSPEEGLTVVVGYPKGLVPIIVVPPPKSVWDTMFTSWNFAAFALSLSFSAGFAFFLWWRRGRDYWWRARFLYDPQAKHEVRPPGAHEQIVVEYTPPEKLRPAEIGTLVDERADTLDVSATIIDLATRGFLTISEEAKKWLFGRTDYILTKTSTDAKALLPYEQELRSRLFETGDVVSISSLKTKFYEDLKVVKDKLYEDMVNKKFFYENPESVRRKYLFVAIGVGVLGVLILVLGFVLVFSLLVAIGAGLAIGGIFLLIVSQIMPRRTADGHEMWRRTKGYELFISTAEKYRQRFFENKNMFNEILPYAIVFGLTEKFAQAFKDMGIEPPQPAWYSGTAPFNAALFGASISSFSSSLSSAMASAPGGSGFSGGGGSSGGGFGGGGGGSW